VLIFAYEPVLAQKMVVLDAELNCGSKGDIFKKNSWDKKRGLGAKYLISFLAYFSSISC
jgi:hypothetical protein